MPNCYIIFNYWIFVYDCSTQRTLPKITNQRFHYISKSVIMDDGISFIEKISKNWKPNMSPVYRSLCDCIVCSMQSENIFFQIWKIPRNLNYHCIENSEQLPRRRQSGVRMTYWSSVFFWELDWRNESELWKSTKKNKIILLDVVKNQNSKHRIVPIILDIRNIKILNISSNFEMWLEHQWTEQWIWRWT